MLSLRSHITKARPFKSPGRYTCTVGGTSKFHPISNDCQRLQHVHFPGITPFEHGQQIQSLLVNAATDFKRITSKANRQRKLAMAQGLALNPYEEQVLGQIDKMRPPPSVLSFEFENVYTGGRKMKGDCELPGKIAGYELVGSKYHQLERGGQVTWHGPGQLTAYVVLDLAQFHKLLVRCFVDAVLIELAHSLLRKFHPSIGIVERGQDHPPGVWVAGKDGQILKIGLVGCSISHGITAYGIALNVRPDLQYLNTFEMCGSKDSRATSFYEMDGSTALVEETGVQYAQEIAHCLGIDDVDFALGASPEQMQ